MEQPQRVFVPETYSEKAVRRFKQNPWVPIGTLATCAALITAMYKMRQGDSRSFNRWLRVRVIAQGLTVAAMVGGTYTLGARNLQASRAEEEQERIRRAEEKREEERRGFEERLRDAEEAHRAEMAFVEAENAATAPSPTKQSKSWSEWLGRGGPKGSS
ncbi:hypothetical protein ONZ45_g1789 [Pleurotus djamor]|nr:hypothetical protein ONZ45_g12938 [Pleurotus djamor]KAJ8521520.1 hypothetical protein ONZ45_g1789 [Pleurotus djamor]